MKNRNFGLDVIRASAIILVLIAHIRYFFVHSYSDDNAFIVSGFLGVELFFVLSGFLIGQIVLKDFEYKISLKKIKNFYIIL